MNALRFPCSCRAALGALVLLALAGSARAQPADALTYRFQPGDHIVYERRATETTDGRGEPARTAHQIDLWCLARERDEWRMLLTCARVSAGRSEPMRGVLFSMDRWGRKRWNAECVVRAAPLDAALDVVPMLATGLQDSRAWTGEPDHFDRRWKCRAEGADAAREGHVRVAFEQDAEFGAAVARGESRRGRFWFDAAGGAVSRVESDDRVAVLGFASETALRLHSRERREPAWTALREADARRFEQALRAEDRLLDSVLTRPEQVESAIEQFARNWSAFGSDVDRRTNSPFAAVGDGRRQIGAGNADRLRGWARLARDWVESPAPGWSLQDAAGAPVTSEAARRGVTIEAFWSAESAMGLRALGPLRQLSQTLAAEKRLAGGCALILVNVDQDANVAKAAIARSPEGLTHVLGGPAMAPAIDDLPALRLLDRGAIVRRVWVGWRPDYREVVEQAAALADAPRR